MTALLLTALLAQATPISQVKFIPLGTPLELKLEGVSEVVRYFRFEEYKVLLQVDFRLQSAEKQVEVYVDIDKKYQAVVDQKDKIITHQQDDIVIYQARAERMKQNWDQAEKRYLDEVGGPIWPYVVAIVGSVLGIVGFTLYLSVELRN